MIPEIITLAEAMEAKLISCRRDLHKYAESGWFEMRTSSLIARRLKDLGYEVLVGSDVCLDEARMGVPEEEKLEAHYQKVLTQGADPEFVEATRGGHTGVIGILRCGEGPTVAMRFDIDALGVVEATDADHRPAKEGFGSVNPGMMHACGHDGHATIGLGVAEVLMAIRQQLAGTVKLIFQPAEEGVRGAKSIVERGHLDGVDYLLASHVTASTGLEAVPVYPGASGSLATCKYDVTFKGLAAHAGGSPHLGKNALVAAANAVMNLYAISRHGGGATRLNVGTLVAGSGRNVIADEAKMEIELRGETTELNAYMVEKAERILKASAEMYDCEYSLRLMGAAESQVSDEALCLRFRDVLASYGMPVPEKLILRAGGSEDVSYMMNRVQEQGGQATFMRLVTDMAAGAHNRRFDFDEKVLANGVKAFCMLTADLMKKPVL